MIGGTYGYWTVTASAGPTARDEPRWLCRCACDKATERPVRQGDLRSGRSTSCGCQTARTRTIWTEEKIEARLRTHSGELGRMPTKTELIKLENSHGLGCAVSKGLGFRRWAQRLSLKQKGGTTHRGQRWEFSEKTFLEGLGYEVEKQTTKAEFDLLVNQYRVDVKSATWTECEQKSGKNKGVVIRGYVFAGLKRGAHCDFFDLLCIEDDQVRHRYIVPSIDAAIVSLTITERTLGGFGKYSSFLNRTDLLERK